LSSKPSTWTEAEQVGCVGVLVGLEKVAAATALDLSTKNLWGWVFGHVRDEIRTWTGIGVYWRKDASRGKSGYADAATGAARRAELRAATKASRKHASMDAPDPEGRTLHDATKDEGLSVEKLFADAEAKARLEQFLGTLTASERKALFSNHPAHARHHLSLVERAKAFVRGDEDGHRKPVRRDRDAVRPHGAAEARGASRR
jgi:hypothetical protein